MSGCLAAHTYFNILFSKKRKKDKDKANLHFRQVQNSPYAAANWVLSRQRHLRAALTPEVYCITTIVTDATEQLMSLNISRGCVLFRTMGREENVNLGFMFEICF